VRFFEYADFLRVIGTYSDVTKMFLLAGALEILRRMTLGIRDCLGGHSGYSNVSPLFLLAGVLEMLRSLILESGNFLTSVPYTFRYWRYFCLQEY
jgi:hypothetical protein